MEKGKIGEEIKIEPKVNTIWEIKEIADDFMNPLEIFREAISNAYDAGAKEIDIQVYINKNNEYDNLTIKISDDGRGMTEDQLRNFWNLGYSEKRNEEREKKLLRTKRSEALRSSRHCFPWSPWSKRRRWKSAGNI